jgi:sugar/nucleoside kinase (ribokinase family)
VSDDFYAFGNAAIDDLVFADGTTTWNAPGGAAIYSALGMAVWTGSAIAFAPIGPEFPLRHLSRLTFACKRKMSHTMRHWGLYEDDGARHFVSRRTSEDWESASPHASDLEAGPYAFCHLNTMPWEHAHGLADALRERGARTISLDIHDRKLSHITFDEYLALAAKVDVLLPSLQDIRHYIPGIAALAALRVLREKLPGVAVIAIKCGSEGVIVHQRGATEIVNVPSVGSHVVDETGAGDAFCGGFLAGYVRANDATEGAIDGSVSASYALATTGFAGLVASSIEDARERATALRKRITLLPLAAS